jgi:hypothetical protein
MTRCHHDLTGCEFPCAWCRRGCHEHTRTAPHAGIGHDCPGFVDADPTDAETSLAKEAVRLFREHDGWGVSLEAPYDPGNFVVVCRDPKEYEATLVAESMRNILAEILAEARARSVPHPVTSTEEFLSCSPDPVVPREPLICSPPSLYEMVHGCHGEKSKP